jgi:hypothetical protein
MYNKPCEQYQEIIEQYACDELGEDKRKHLEEHIQECEYCRAYVEGLQTQEADIKQWLRSLEPMIETGQANLLQQFRQLPDSDSPVRGTAERRGWLRFAIAASILVVMGFLAGQAFRPSVDFEQLQQQWATSIQPQLEKQITASVVQSLRPGIFEEYTKLQTALSEQISDELKTYAEQTVMRNDLQTYRLLTELIEAIETAQVKNQQWALTAMAELENQRLQDQEAFQNQVAVLAAYTGSELFRTQQAIEALSSEEN